MAHMPMDSPDTFWMLVLIYDTKKNDFPKWGKRWRFSKNDQIRILDSRGLKIKSFGELWSLFDEKAPFGFEMS